MNKLATHEELAFKILKDENWVFKKPVKVKKDILKGQNYNTVIGGWSKGGIFTSFGLPGEFPNALSKVYQCILNCESRIEVREDQRKFCKPETNTVSFDLLFPNNVTSNYGRAIVMQLKNTESDVEYNLDSNPTLALIISNVGLFVRFTDKAMTNNFTQKELIPFSPKNITKNNGYKHWISISINYKKLKNKVKFKVNAKDKVNNIKLDHSVINNELYKDNLKFGLVHLQHDQDAKYKTKLITWYRNIRCYKGT
jgi:hypothetical protein